MTALAGVLVVAALAVGFVAALGVERRRRKRALSSRTRVRRIAFPFTGMRSPSRRSPPPCGWRGSTGRR